MKTIKSLLSQIRSAPTTAGVYIFRDKDTIWYIGKAVNIRARLLSHVQNAKLDRKEAAIIAASTRIETIVTDSEFKALLLESQMISKVKPKYNVRWRDDKSYLYIKVTASDEFPKVFLARAPRQSGNAAGQESSGHLYFGPFPSVHTAENILKEIRRIYPFCTQRKITKAACFYHKIGLCNPCPNTIVKLLYSPTRPIPRHPELDSGSQRRDNAEHYTYENHKEGLRLKKLYRTNIRQVIKLLSGNTDSVLKSLYAQMKKASQVQDYEAALPLRRSIRRLESLVQGKRLDSDRPEEFNRSAQSLAALYALLSPHIPGLAHPIARIECYDNSTLSFTNSTASMVVMTDGLADRREYKRFKMKNAKAQSDFEMMEEILTRRVKHQDWPQPDLVVIDGGKPQLAIAAEVFARDGLTSPYIGIAKHPDRLIIPSYAKTPNGETGATESFLTLHPHRSDLGFRLIQQARDEAHRFAKKYHTYLRSRQHMI